MRPHKNFSYFLACLLLASTALCGPRAYAANASFNAHVRVVRHAAAIAPLDVPAPPGAQKLTTSPAGESYVFAGEGRSAGEFFRRAMVERGYRLIHAGADDRLLMWDRNGQRVRIEMDAVLGNQHATRIVVRSDA